MGNIIYFTAAFIFSCGLFIMITSNNYLRKVIGLGIFQSAILIFYIALGKVERGIPPLLKQEEFLYSNPLPHVLMLTAIVVGFATLAVALALIYRIFHYYGTIEENEILDQGEIDDIN